MINFEYLISNLSDEEINTWFDDAYKSVEEAYNNDDIALVNKLNMVIDIVKQIIATKNNTNESFRHYLHHAILTENVETTENVVDLLTISDIFDYIKNNVTDDVYVNLDVHGIVENDIITSIAPITIYITFNIFGVNDNQCITIQYTPTDVINVNLDNIPNTDYRIKTIDGQSEIHFKQLNTLAEEIIDVGFTESIKWPMDIEFKNKTVSNNFNKEKTLEGKIVKLLGPEKYINKIIAFKSDHQKATNQATRSEKFYVKALNDVLTNAKKLGGVLKKDKTQNALKCVNGVKSVNFIDLVDSRTHMSYITDENNKKYQNPDDSIYTYLFTVKTSVDDDTYNIFMARTLTDDDINNGKTEYCCRIGTYGKCIYCQTRNDALIWLIKILDVKIKEHENKLRKMSAIDRSNAEEEANGWGGSLKAKPKTPKKPKMW